MQSICNLQIHTAHTELSSITIHTICIKTHAYTIMFSRHLLEIHLILIKIRSNLSNTLQLITITPAVS